MIENLLGFFKVTSMPELIWVMVGLAGQIMFTGRFLIQWLASERAKRSVVPISFWWLSMAGGLILFCYAVHRRDPVFILGQSTGIFIYARNLWLLYAEKHSK